MSPATSSGGGLKANDYETAVNGGNCQSLISMGCSRRTRDVGGHFRFCR